MNFKPLNSDKYALVAGGSKGIGLGIATALAKRNYNLVIIARNEINLTSAKKLLESKFGIDVIIIVQDLSDTDAAENIIQSISTQNLKICMLCNVAGLGGSHDFLSLSNEELKEMILLNISSPVSLSELFIPMLEKNSPSYILNVASMAGFAPIPKKNLYASTKSALLFFSYSLYFQLKEKKIHVSCLCPGPVYTKPEIKKETVRNLGKLGDAMAMTPEDVGEIAVRQCLKGKMLIIPGKLAKIMSVFVRLLPPMLLTWIYYRIESTTK